MAVIKWLVLSLKSELVAAGTLPNQCHILIDIKFENRLQVYDVNLLSSLLCMRVIKFNG